MDKRASPIGTWRLGAEGEATPVEGSRGEFVHEAIKAGIREGVLVPGQRLREREVAEWLGVSRTPVREAFRMLQAQGVLSQGKGDSLVITTLSEADMRELYRIWADMEAISARYAARQASRDDIERLHEVAARWDEHLEPNALGRLNQDFHRAIQAAAHNRYLSRALDAIDDSLALLGLNTYTVPGRPAEAGREHLEIVRAIALRDEQAAFQAGRLHIERAGELRLALFRQKSQN